MFFVAPEIKAPVFIIGCYRGGTSIVFRLLSESRELWSLYRESNHMWQRYHRHPDEVADTVILGNSDVREGDRQYFDNHYHYSSYNSYALGQLGRVRLLRERLTPVYDSVNIANYLSKSLCLKDYRIVDKTPPNAYRISFLEKLYPDAKFIHLTRDGMTNTSSLMNAWRDKDRFKYRYRKYLTDRLAITNYDDDVWKFSIPENYEAYLNKSLARVCAYQWADCHEHALRSFSHMDSRKYIRLKFEDLMASPATKMQEICDFTEVSLSGQMRKIINAMPLVNTASKPNSEKQSRNSIELEEIREMIAPVQEALGYNINPSDSRGLEMSLVKPEQQ